jgi:hypothetical protein
MIAKTDTRNLVEQVRAAIPGRAAEIVAGLLPDGIARGREWFALNPSRPDTHLGSFSVAVDGPNTGQYFDFSNGDRGDMFDLVRMVTGSDFKGAVQYLARAVGISVPDPRLTIRRPPAGAVAEWKRREASGEANGRGCTVADLARAKALPPDFLYDLGLRDLPGRPATADHAAWVPAVLIPYTSRAGDTVAQRIRSDIVAKLGTKWKTGATLIPYGLDRLHGDEDALWLVEGESDSWVCWNADLIAVGLPGAGTWRDEWAAMLPTTAIIYVVQEPDAAGSALIERLRQSPLADRLRVVHLPVKDPADLWTSDPNRDRFLAAMASACATADQPMPALTPSSASPESATKSDPKPAPIIIIRTHADRERERTCPPPMIVDGCLPVGGIGALVAMPGIGKTLVAIELARCVAGGHDFAGHAVESGAALYFCTDAPASTERRMLAIKPEDAARIITVTESPSLPGGLEAMREVVVRVNATIGIPVKLVIFDTWDSIRDHTSGGYSDQDGLAESILRGLRTLAADLSLAFVIIHHATRQDGGRARGTVVFDARCDWIAVVEQNGPNLLLNATKARDGERGPLGAWTIRPVAVADRPVPTLMPANAAEVIADIEQEEKDLRVLLAASRAAAVGAAVSYRSLGEAVGMKGKSSPERSVQRLRLRGWMDRDTYSVTPAGMAIIEAKCASHTTDFDGGVGRGGGTGRPTEIGTRDDATFSGENVRPTGTAHRDDPTASHPSHTYIGMGGGTGTGRGDRLVSQPHPAEDGFADQDDAGPVPGRPVVRQPVVRQPLTDPNHAGDWRDRAAGDT